MNKQTAQILEELNSQADPEYLKGMARFGIRSANKLGIPTPALRKLAKEIGRNHALAIQLWASEVFEARVIAGLIDDPKQVTEEQMESWAEDFDSWAIVDGTCGSLFDKTPFAHAKASEWSERAEEYVKRAGFVLMATLSVHDKKSGDEAFLYFLPIIERESTDDRNFVKKAVNWALRQIGKRNLRLHAAAIDAAEKIKLIDSRSARWIASDALRELRSDKIIDILRRKAAK